MEDSFENPESLDASRIILEEKATEVGEIVNMGHDASIRGTASRIAAALSKWIPMDENGEDEIVDEMDAEKIEIITPHDPPSSVVPLPRTTSIELRAQAVAQTQVPKYRFQAVANKMAIQAATNVVHAAASTTAATATAGGATVVTASTGSSIGSIVGATVALIAITLTAALSTSNFRERTGMAAPDLVSIISPSVSLVPTSIISTMAPVGISFDHGFVPALAPSSLEPTPATTILSALDDMHPPHVSDTTLVVCDDIEDGLFVIHIDGIPRMPNDFEVDFFQNTLMELYNQILGGCSGPIESFLENAIIDKQDFIVSDSGEAYLVQHWKGQVRCNGCGVYPDSIFLTNTELYSSNFVLKSQFQRVTEDDDHSSAKKDLSYGGSLAKNVYTGSSRRHHLHSNTRTPRDTFPRPLKIEIETNNSIFSNVIMEWERKLQIANHKGLIFSEFEFGDKIKVLYGQTVSDMGEVISSFGEVRPTFTYAPTHNDIGTQSPTFRTDVPSSGAPMSRSFFPTAAPTSKSFALSPPAQTFAPSNPPTSLPTRWPIITPFPTKTTEQPTDTQKTNLLTSTQTISTSTPNPTITQTQVLTSTTPTDLQTTYPTSAPATNEPDITENPKDEPKTHLPTSTPTKSTPTLNPVLTQTQVLTSTAPTDLQTTFPTSAPTTKEPEITVNPTDAPKTDLLISTPTISISLQPSHIPTFNPILTQTQVLASSTPSVLQTTFSASATTTNELEITEIPTGIQKSNLPVLTQTISTSISNPTLAQIQVLTSTNPTILQTKFPTSAPTTNEPEITEKPIDIQNTNLPTSTQTISTSTPDLTLTQAQVLTSTAPTDLQTKFPTSAPITNELEITENPTAELKANLQASTPTLSPSFYPSQMPTLLNRFTGIDSRLVNYTEEVDFHFTVSNVPWNAIFYNKDCYTPIVPGLLGPTTREVVNDMTSKVISITVQVDTHIIQNDTSGVWSKLHDSSVGYVEYCLRTNLFADELKTEPFSSTNTKVVMAFHLSDGNAKLIRISGQFVLENVAKTSYQSRRMQLKSLLASKKYALDFGLNITELRSFYGK